MSRAIRSFFRPGALLLALILSLSFYGLAQPQVVPSALSETRLQQLEAYFGVLREQGKVSGAVHLVGHKGEVVWLKTHGSLDPETGAPMPEDAIFYMMSMTKPIVTTGLMILYEEGHFELNDPVEKYLPYFAERQVQVAESGKAKGDGAEELVPAARSITIAHLMSHTAGLLHGLGSSELERRYAMTLYGKPHQTIEDRVKAMASLPLIDHPGEAWHYSAATDVLAVLIEHFSGQPAATFLKERIFDPLGMEDTGYNISDEALGRVVPAYQMDPQSGQLKKHPRQIPRQGNTVFGGTHGLYATAGDYFRFAQMLLNGGTLDGKQILSPKTVELMRVNHVGDKYDTPGFGFGLGFGVRTDLADAKMLGSEGMYFWNGAWNTYFFIDPEEELISIYLMQFDPYTDLYRRKHMHFIYQSLVD